MQGEQHIETLDKSCDSAIQIENQSNCTDKLDFEEQDHHKNC